VIHYDTSHSYLRPAMIAKRFDETVSSFWFPFPHLTTITWLRRTLIKLTAWKHLLRNF